jgi:hypothetical protein
MSHTDHNHHRQDHVTHAAAELGAYTSHPDTHSDSELLLTLSDLAAVATLVGELADRSRRELASWATVSPHLALARDQALDLARSLNHACGTLAFNSAARADTAPVTVLNRSHAPALAA